MKPAKNKNLTLVLLLLGFSFQALADHKNKKTSFSSQSFKLKQPVIDNNYLDYQAVLAYLKAETAFLEKDAGLALEHLKTAQVFSRDSSHLIERRADFYKQEGLCTEAVNVYKKWINKYGAQTRIQKKIMECYVLNGLNDLALKTNESLLKKEPESFWLWFQKSILLIGEKKWSEGLKVFQYLLSQELTLEEKAQTLAFQSYAFSQLEKKEDALKSYHRLLGLGFPNEPAVLRIGDLYRKIGKEAWAISYVSQFQIKRAVTKHNASFLFDIAFSSGDWEQAFKQTENLEALGSLKKPHRFYRAFYLGELEKHEQAIPYLRDLVFEDPKNGQYQYMLAFSYVKKDQIKKAFSAYKKVSPTSPYFLISRLDLAKLLEKQGENEKSLSLLKSLAFGETMRPFAVSEYAKSLWKLGERKKALVVLTSALKQAPSNADLLNLKASYSEKLRFAGSVL